jgi:hypothetical protein
LAPKTAKTLRSLAILAGGVALITVSTASGGLAARTVRHVRSKPPTWGQILIISQEPEGGRHPAEAAELYDPATNRFASRPPVMQWGWIEATATVITVGRNAGKVLVAGGMADVGGPLNRTGLYDPARNRFTPGPDMTQNGDYSAAAVIPSGAKAGWILVGGLVACELYTPFANRFTMGPFLLNGEQSAIVISSGPHAGKILFAGGLYGASLKTTEFYNPATNAFEPGPALHSGRANYTATVLTTGPNSGKILLVGGWLPRDTDESSKLVALASTELYDPVTNTFALPSATPIMNIARAAHTATMLSVGPNAGKLLIAGGQRGEDDDTILSSTELYDPLTNRFTLGPPLRETRTQHVAMVIPAGPAAGKLLIAGGRAGRPYPACMWFPDDCKSIPLASTELYDPATNSFVPGPRMHGAPGEVIAVQLPPAPPHR